MNKAVFKIVDYRGRITLPKALREKYGIEAGYIVSLKMDAGKIAVKKAVVLEDNGDPARAQRSGSCGERRSSGTSERSRLRGCEGCGACDDAMPPDAKLAYVQTVLREFSPDYLGEILEQAVRLIKEQSPPV